MKKLISILLCGMLMLTMLAACAKTETSTDAAADTAPQTENAAEQSGDAAAAQTTIVWQSWDSYSKYEAAILAFEQAHPEIHVEYEQVSDYMTKIMTEATSDELPDLISCKSGYTPIFADAGILQALDVSALQADAEYDYADFWETTYDYCTYDGTYYALPIDGGGYAWVYNEQMFDKLGITVPENGVIAAGGKEIQGMNPMSVYRAGIHIAYVPEDRLGMGLIPSMGMAENVMLRSFERTGSFFLDKKTAVQDSARMVKELDIATPDLLTPVSRLSGGNVQKVLLEREIQDHPQLLIAAYPVRGLDIGASYKIYDMMTAEKLRGACVLFIGEDLDALLGICDRILVLCGGEAAGYVKPAETTKNEIGYMMMNGGIGKEEMAV